MSNKNNDKVVSVYSNSSGSNITYNRPDGSHESQHSNSETNKKPVYAITYPGLGKCQVVYNENGQAISETITDDKGNIIRQWKR